MSKDYIKLPNHDVEFELAVYLELKKILKAGTGITIVFNDTNKTVTIRTS